MTKKPLALWPSSLDLAWNDPDKNLALMTEFLSSAEYATSWAEDGELGLAVVEKEKPDLVICDFAMPRMHGFEVCRRIRANPELKGIKILMCSSKSYTTMYLNHPSVTVGFRFDAGGKSVCYLSDHEPYGKLNAAGSFSAKENAAVADFVAGRGLLISEAQYTEEEYKLKKTWGHSTFTDVVNLAVRAH